MPPFAYHMRMSFPVHYHKILMQVVHWAECWDAQRVDRQKHGSISISLVTRYPPCYHYCIIFLSQLGSTLEACLLTCNFYHFNAIFVALGGMPCFDLGIFFYLIWSSLFWLVRGLRRCDDGNFCAAVRVDSLEAQQCKESKLLREQLVL
jgi:hypothetical protein